MESKLTLVFFDWDPLIPPKATGIIELMTAPNDPPYVNAVIPIIMKKIKHKNIIAK